MLCKYKHIFGEPNKGIHSYRIFDIAIIDLFATIVVAYIISKKYKYSFLNIFTILLIIAVIIHRLFCVNTKINKLLFH